MKPARTATFSTIALHAALLALAAIALLPFIWLICASSKSGPGAFDSLFIPWQHPSEVGLSNFSHLLQTQPFGAWLINSIFLSSICTVLVVALSSLAGFALAKYRFPGRQTAMLILLASVLVPPQVALPGAYEVIHNLGWIDSYWAIIIPGAVNIFGIFLFRQAAQNVPDELLQSARLDGCDELRIWWEIALPIMRPMVGAFTLLSFLASWNSFLWPQIVLQSESKYTLPLALTNLTGMPGYQRDFGMVMAATLISIVPVIILFFGLQKDFVSGLASGAVKG